MIARLLVACGLLAGCDRLFAIEFTPNDAPVAIDTRAVTDGPPIPGRCSQMSMLADDFTNGHLEYMWPTLQGIPTPSEANGTATLVLGSAAHSASAYAVVDSERYYDLRDSQLSMEIFDTGVGDGSYDLTLVSQQTPFGIQITRTPTQLVFDKIENQMSIEVGRITYDPVADRYWRFSNAADVTTWATSPDGVTYTPQLQLSGLAYVGFMRAVVFAAQASTVDYVVTIADVNGGTPTGSACLAAALQDDFNGAALDPQWQGRSNSYDGTLVQSNGQIAMTMGDDDNNVGITLGASTIYDLRESAFAVEIPQMIDTSLLDANMYLAVQAPDGSQAAIKQTAGQLEFLKNGGNAIIVALYDPTNDKWWRIRNTGGVMYWDVSADGMNYTNVAQANDLGTFDRVDVVINVDGTTKTATTALVDNFNVTP